MDVPPALLVPPEAYGRGFCPQDAALVVDGWLRRLAAQDARGRTVLGRLAQAFLRGRGHYQLGFSRLGDYSRERLGISARELQSLATVCARLERLPRLRAAFVDGVLSWAQIRLLTTVATPEDEAEWLARAERCTVRALAAVIRTPPDGEDDDEARFRLRCPRRLRLLWQQVVDLARCMAGSELTQGQAAEAIAAEGLSARAPCGEPWPAAEPPRTAPADPHESRAVFADLDWTAIRDALPGGIEGLDAAVDGLDPFALDLRMRAVPVRRLADEVEWALTLRDGLAPIMPPAPGASLALDERQLCARPEWEFPDAEVTFSAPVSVVALFRSAILAFAHPHGSLVEGLESLLLHVISEWEGQPRHRDPVFARDGWRCAVPICTARRELHDHHVVFRSHGGGNERENRISICVWHHLRGVHAGRVRAAGEAPDGITWEIGVRPGRRALLRL